MWYNTCIVNSTRRRLALGALAALAAVPAAAQEPRPVAALRGAQMALALPASGEGAAARLDRLFDDAALRPSRLPEPVAVPQAPVRRAAPPMTARRAAARLHQELVVPVPRETPAYRRTFRALLAHPEVTDRYDDLILKYARRYRLDARFLKSVMAAESEFDPDAHSPAGARGLMQVMPVTAASVGVSPSRLYDPERAIQAGAAYFQILFKTAWRLFHLKGVRYTDVPHWVMQRVIAAYHAGPKFLTRSHWYRSTRAYVRKVVLFYNSKVTDFRRPVRSAHELPTFSDAVAPSGTFY